MGTAKIWDSQKRNGENSEIETLDKKPDEAAKPWEMHQQEPFSILK